MFFIKINSPQVFYNGTSGCLESIDKIADMREKIERACADFIRIQKDMLYSFALIVWNIRLG